MDKNKKGLADRGEGDFILNESGTSVNIDKVETPSADDLLKKTNNQEEPFIPPVAEEQKDTTD